MGRIASDAAPAPVRPDGARHERPATPFVARAVAADAYRRALALDPHFSPHADVALEVLGELGRGGMGVVYRVRDRRLGREAALKVLLHPPDHADVQRRFRREAEVTARLDHPAIPPVYEAGTDARGRHYMLMRLIEGESLAQKIAAHHAGREDAPASRELLEVLVKVGEAVAYAHGRGVLHRDLKPANVMVGRFGEVLVMDWGLARRLDRDGADDDALLIRSGTHLTLPVAADPLGHDAAGLTEAGTVLGTPGYMAPEQAIGGALDERTDVFALGAILVEILTGRPPVDGGTPLQRLQRTAAGKVEGARERRPDLPPELHDLAAAALRRAPAERTARAEDLVADLRAFLAGAEVSTHRYAPRERALRAARRHPAHVVAGAAALVLAAVALAASAAQPRAVGEETPTGASARTAARPLLVPPAAAGVVAPRVGQHRVATATEHDQAGLARRETGDLEGAVEAHTQALQLDRSLVTAYVNRGAARHELGELAAALDDYERAITLDPTCAMAFANRAVARRALGELRAALADADVAVRLEPDNAVARVNRGLIRQELGDLPGAIEDLTRALDLDPRQPVTWSHRGLAHQAAGDLWRAAADHDRAVALAPRDARLRVHRAITRRALGDLPGARDDADLAVELDPACAAAWNVRGLVLHEEGELTAAVQAFDRALTLDPTSAPVHHNRGLARRAAGDLGGAIADQGRALELAPSLAVAWGARGCAREEQGDLEGARGDLDQALTLDPSWTEPLRCRAVVRAALGDLAGARADVDRLSELAPDAAEVVALRAELGL